MLCFSLLLLIKTADTVTHVERRLQVGHTDAVSFSSIDRTAEAFGGASIKEAIKGMTLSARLSTK